MTAQALSLIAVALGIGAILLLQHYTGLHRLPVQARYALGLGTELIGLLGWAAGWGLLPWWLALCALAACCLAGAPLAVILLHEQKAEAWRWAELTRTNREQAARLALLQRTSPREFRRVRDLAETLSFTVGAAQRESADLRLFAEQISAVLGPIIGNGEGE